jgi:hypothetical protein
MIRNSPPRQLDGSDEALGGIKSAEAYFTALQAIAVAA